MHLVILENEPSAARGGQEISLLDVCRGLATRGHLISLIYNQPGDLLEKYQRICTDLIAVHHYRINRNQPLQSALKFWQEMRSIPIRTDSLIYSNQYQNSLFGYGLARLRRLPFVCHLRQPPSVLGWQWRTGLQGADRLIAVSQQNQTDWIEANFSAQKITVVYNGVDPERFRPCDRQLAKQQFGFTSTDKLVTYVGRLDQSKGIETLLRAFALLPMNTQPHLLIVGKPVLNKPAYEASLKQLASILGVANQVTFWGYLANPIAAFQASDVVVVPSVWSEPFGRIIVEAMACGTPVLASRIGGIPEILGGEFTSGLFAPGNAEDLANKLQNRLNWQQTDPTLGQRCRQHVMQQFTLKQTIDGIEQVFIEVTQARSAIALNETEAAYRTQIN